jgi:hypothetical protein
VRIRTQAEYGYAQASTNAARFQPAIRTFFDDVIVSSRGILLAVPDSVCVEVDTFSIHAPRHRPDEARRTGPMESIRVTPERSRRADATISDVANVQNEVATLFKRFQLALEQIVCSLPQKGGLGHDVTHLTTRRTRTR